MPQRKILESRVIHRTTGFLVFNAGETAEVPADLIVQFEDEGVIARSSQNASGANPPKKAPKGGVPSDASNTSGTREGVDGAASAGGVVGTGDAPAD